MKRGLFCFKVAPKFTWKVVKQDINMTNRLTDKATHGHGRYRRTQERKKSIAAFCTTMLQHGEGHVQCSA